MLGIFSNSVVFSAEGGNYEKLINYLIENSFNVSKIKANDFGFTARIYAKEYRQLRKIAKKNGCKIRIKTKKGVAFRLYPLRKRYGILTGAIVFFILTLLMPRLVWNIDFYNISIKNQRHILTQMQKVGVYAGAVQNNQSILNAQQQVLISTPEYSWIAINFIRGKIIVEAEQSTQNPNIIDNQTTHIVAGCDAIIKNIKVYEGTQIKETGQSVAKGELLVSGSTPTGFSVSQGRSRADIIGYVEKEYILQQPLNYTEIVPTGKILEDKILIFGSWEFPYQKAPTLENSQEKIYYDNVKLFGFALPFAVKTIRYIELEEIQVNLTEKRAKLYAQALLDKILYQDLPCPEIITQSTDYTIENKTLTAKMKITADCDIGVVVQQ